MELNPDHARTIPKGWNPVPLGSVGKWLSGGTPSMRNEAYWSGDMPWISPKDMKVVRLTDGVDHISQQAVVDGARVAPPGAVLVVVRGMILAHSFPVAVADRSLAFNQDIKAVVPTDQVDSDFLLYWLISNAQRLRSLTTESTHGTRRLPMESLFAEVVLLPGMAEQRKVARAMRDMDALIESLEQLLAKKRHLKQGAMQELLTGKKRLPGFAASWPERTMASLFEFSGGLSASRAQLSSEGHCYLHYGDIHGASKTFIDVRADNQSIPRLNVPLAKVASKSLLADGDVVFVDASEDDEGSSKHVVIVNKDRIPFISGLHTIVAKGRTDELSHSYRRYCFQTRSVKQQFRFFSVGTKVSGISKTNIAKVTLPVPPADEQEAVAAILADMDSELDALEAKLTKARQIKQGMMQELLTGRIRLV